MQQQIFAPLEMNSSFTSPLEAHGAGLAEGHRYWFGQARATTLPYPRGLLPAGYLVSNAEDMGRYLLAHLNGGRAGGANILTVASVAELHRPGIAIDTGVWSAMGWTAIDAGGVRVLQHEGSTLNYRADMYLLPETGWGFVLLMNADDKLQETPARGIGRGVATLLMGQEPEPVGLNPLAHAFYGAVMAIGALYLLYGEAEATVLHERYEREQRAASRAVQISNELIFRNMAVRNPAIGALRSALLGGLGRIPAVAHRMTETETLLTQAIPTTGIEHSPRGGETGHVVL